MTAYLVGGFLLMVAAAGVAALRYAKRAARAEIEKEQADAIAAAKDRANGVLRKRRTRSTVTDKLRDGDF